MLALLGPFRLAGYSRGYIRFKSLDPVKPPEYTVHKSRILAAFEKDGRIYIVVDASRDELVYSARLPADARRLRELAFELETGEVFVAWRDPGRLRDLDGVHMEDVDAKRVVELGKVTVENATKVAERLADWDAVGTRTISGATSWWERGDVLARVKLTPPFHELVLGRGGVLSTHDWDFCCDDKPVEGFIVELTVETPRGLTAFYKLFKDKAAAEEFFKRVEAVLKTYVARERGGREAEAEAEAA